MIGVDKALAAGLDGRGVIIGVQDSGLDITHPEFVGRLGPISYDAFLGGPVFFDPVDHGTHVAGIIAANRDGRFIHGVAPGATIAPFRIGDPGEGWSVQVNKSLRYAVANGVRFINASWGAPGPHTANTPSDIFVDRALEVSAFKEVVAAGGVMIFANGNDGSDLAPALQPALPIYLPELERGWLAVASVGPTGMIAPYSQRCADAGQWCLAAPGGDTSVAGLAGAIWSSVPGGFAPMQGTSMAAPHVSGALAIAQQLYPKAAPQQLRLLVLQTATDIGATGIDPVYGWGLLNVANIVATSSPEAGTVYAQQPFTRQGVVNHVIDTLNPTASSERDGQWGFWMQPLGLTATLDANSASVAHTGAGGLSVGVEGSIAPDWYLKAFGGLSQATTSSDAGSSHETGLHLGGQIVYETPAWWGDATLGGSIFSGSTSRTAAPGLAGTVLGGAGGPIGTSSATDFAQWAAFRFGYHVDAGEAGSVSPYLFGRGVNQQVSAFTENGTVLAVSGAAGNLFTGEVGVGLKWMGPAFTTGPLEVTPVLDVAYSRQTTDYSRSVSVLGNTLTASPGTIGADTLQLSVAAEISSSESPFDLKLGYSGQFQSGAQVHAVSLKVMGAF
ncbi:MAG TPA: S8 family serine peptidase [Devosia sp.]|nr:S8 family serine peptidase [Devosia sp.]